MWIWASGNGEGQRKKKLLNFLDSEALNTERSNRQTGSKIQRNFAEESAEICATGVEAKVVVHDPAEWTILFVIHVDCDQSRL